MQHFTMENLPGPEGSSSTVDLQRSQGGGAEELYGYWTGMWAPTPVCLTPFIQIRDSVFLFFQLLPDNLDSPN